LIPEKLMDAVLYDTVARGATRVPPVVLAAFEAAIARETSQGTKVGLERTYESILLSAQTGRPVCPDTGWPMFYFKVGNEAAPEGGMTAWKRRRAAP